MLKQDKMPPIPAALLTKEKDAFMNRLNGSNLSESDKELLSKLFGQTEKIINSIKNS